MLGAVPTTDNLGEDAGADCCRAKVAPCGSPQRNDRVDVDTRHQRQATQVSKPMYEP